MRLGVERCSGPGIDQEGRHGEGKVLRHRGYVPGSVRRDVDMYSELRAACKVVKKRRKTHEKVSAADRKGEDEGPGDGQDQPEDESEPGTEGKRCFRMAPGD